MANVKLVCKCPFCGKVNMLVVNAKEYQDGIQKYNAGACVQDAFPAWNIDQREFILTGNCSCMWG